MRSVGIGEFSVQNSMCVDPETYKAEFDSSACDTELALTCEYPRKPPVIPERETLACKSVQAIGAGTFKSLLSGDGAFSTYQSYTLLVGILQAHTD